MKMTREQYLANLRQFCGEDHYLLECFSDRLIKASCTDMRVVLKISELLPFADNGDMGITRLGVFYRLHFVHVLCNGANARLQ